MSLTFRTLGTTALATALSLFAVPSAEAARKTPTPKPSPTAHEKTPKTVLPGDDVANTPVDLNKASKKMLEDLPGVGAATAKAIVKARPFRSVEDLENVKGIGPAKYAKLKNLVTVGGSSAPVSRKGRDQAGPDGAPTPGSAGAGSGGRNQGTSDGAPAATGKSGRSTYKLAPGQKVNINTAGLEELEALPEIGPVKGQAIIDYRRANGRFQSPEDIEKVKGIKAGTFAKIQDWITVR